MLRLTEPDPGGVPDYMNTALRAAAGTDASTGGLEGWPAEVSELLFHANEESKALRAERRSLRARIAELENELRGVKAKNQRLSARMGELQQALLEKDTKARPSDEEWIAGVADRTAHALRSSQEVAQGIIQRARQRALEIEHAALQEASEIKKRAEAEAQRTLTVANYDAEGLLQGAQASSEELLSQARKVRDRALAQFAERRAALQEEIDRLEARRVGLLETYAAIKDSVDEAIHTLESAPAARSNRKAGRALREWWRGDTDEAAGGVA